LRGLKYKQQKVRPGKDLTKYTALQGFQKTGLGERVAIIFAKLFGKSTLGLAYGLSASETLFAPARPSTTARAGSIFMPIISSLDLASGSKPGTLSSVSGSLPHLPFL